MFILHIRARTIVRARIFELDQLLYGARMRSHLCSMPHTNARPTVAPCCVDTRDAPSSRAFCTCIVVLCRLQPIRAVICMCDYCAHAHSDSSDVYVYVCRMYRRRQLHRRCSDRRYTCDTSSIVSCMLRMWPTPTPDDTVRLRHRPYADVGDHCDVCDIDGDADYGDCVWSARRVQCMFALIHTVPDPHICPRSDCLMYMNIMYTPISARQWSDTDGPVRHMSATAAARWDRCIDVIGECGNTADETL